MPHLGLLGKHEYPSPVRTGAGAGRVAGFQQCREPVPVKHSFLEPSGASGSRTCTGLRTRAGPADIGVFGQRKGPYRVHCSDDVESLARRDTQIPRAYGPHQTLTSPQTGRQKSRMARMCATDPRSETGHDAREIKRKGNWGILSRSRDSRAKSRCEGDRP